MTLDRRRLLTSLAAGTVAAGLAPALRASRGDAAAAPAPAAPLRNARGEVDWDAVRALYLTTGAADLYLETGETLLLETLTRQWQDMVESKLSGKATQKAKAACRMMYSGRWYGSES